MGYSELLLRICNLQFANSVFLRQEGNIIFQDLNM